MALYIYNPYYLIVLCLQFHHLAKFIHNPEINTWGFFTVIPRHAHTQSSEKFGRQVCTSPLRSSKVLLLSDFSFLLSHRDDHRMGTAGGSTV